MKLNQRIVAAAAALTTATLALPAAAQVYVSTDQASFDAIRKGYATTAFSFDKTAFHYGVNVGSTYTANPTDPAKLVTFKSDTLYKVNDGAYGTGTSYLADGSSGRLNVTYNGPVLGLFLASFGGAQTVDYTVNGIAKSITLGADRAVSFLGFDNGGKSTQISVTFEHCSELDILGFQTAVPEASTWAMMMVGVGAVGGSLRRRRRAAGTGRIRFA